jgi:hypothetical protein
MMSANSIEGTIEEVLTSRHFTTNQLALCNVFYNVDDKGLSLMEAAKRIGKGNPSQIGGITSQLAQRIDSIGPLEKRFGFTGYILFFENIGDKLRMRSEFRKVIHRYPEFKKVMTMKTREVYTYYKKGIDL